MHIHVGLYNIYIRDSHRDNNILEDRIRKDENYRETMQISFTYSNMIGCK